MYHRAKFQVKLCKYNTNLNATFEDNCKRTLKVEGASLRGTHSNDSTRDTKEGTMFGLFPDKKKVKKF